MPISQQDELAKSLWWPPLADFKASPSAADIGNLPIITKVNCIIV